MAQSCRLFSLLVALMMLLSAPALADSVSLSAPGELPLAEETIHFTVGVAQSSMVEDWNTNAQTRLIEEALNVELEFVELPSDKNELIQKVELMIMAGGDELPDIIMSDLGGLPNLVKYGQMGMIVPTTEYYRELSYYTDQTLAVENLSKEDMLRYVTCYDGEIYGLFTYAASLNNSYSSARAMVFEPWYEEYLKAAGIERVSTTAQFQDMLTYFRDNDMDGDGDATNEIPMMGYNNAIKTNFMRYLLNPFVYTQANYYNYNDGKIEFAATSDGWREGVKWIKSLMDEGLISPLSLTQDQAQLTAIMSEEPEKVGVIARISSTNLGAADIRRSQYICLDPLQGPDGTVNAVFEPRIPHISMVITKNCENPQAAFRLGDYMCEEMLSVWNRYGEKGVDWAEPAEGAKGVYESQGYPAAIKVISTWGVLQNQWWGQVGPYVLLDKYASGQAVENVEYNGAVAIGRSMDKYIEYKNEHPITGLVFNEEEQEIVNEFQSTIEEYVVQSFSQFITGARDIDAEWDDYVNEFSKMGLEPYMAAVQSCYDRMHP